MQNKSISSRKTVERKPNDPINLSPTTSPQAFPQSASRMGVVSTAATTASSQEYLPLSEKFVHLVLSLL